MGIVYEAQQISLGRRVALKVLPLAGVLDPRQLQRFKTEAQAAAQLHHPHIVPVFFVGSERGVHFYAMQFIEGQTLAEVIVALRSANPRDHDSGTTSTVSIGGGPDAHGAKPRSAKMAEGLVNTRESEMTAANKEGVAPASTRPKASLSTEGSTKSGFFRTVARLGINAAEALEHAHNLGVVHRDIKPSNLMVDGQGTLWITDFGLARFASDSDLTMTGDLLGTPRYMSPEQTRGSPAVVDHRTDIYSLGVTLYEILALEPAFTGSNRHEILRKIVDQEPRPLRQMNRSIPADLETIVLKAMAKDPAGRFPAAQALADDLQRFLDNRPILARRPTLAERTLKWGRRHPSLVVSAVVFLLLAFCGLSVGMFLLAREQQATRSAAQRAQDNLLVARQAVDDMYSRVAIDWMEDRPGITPLQREFLERAMTLYEKFSSFDGHDEATRYQAAMATLRVGTIRDRLGQFEPAEQAYRQAIALFKVPSSDPKFARSFSRGLAESYNNLALCLGDHGRSVEADAALRNSIRLARDLVEQAPDDHEARAALADALNGLGVLMLNRQNFGEAEDKLDESRRQREMLVAHSEQPTKHRIQFGGTLHNLGLLNQSRGDLRAALESTAAAIEQQTQALLAEPHNYTARQFMHNHHVLRAHVLWDLGQNEQARAEWRETIQRARQLREDFPQTPAIRELVLKDYRDFAELLIEESAVDEVEQLLKEGFPLAEKLIAEFPGVPSYVGLASSLELQRAELHKLKGQSLEAKRSYEAAVDRQEKLVQSKPELIDARHLLGQICYQFSAFLLLSGDSSFHDVRRGGELARKAVDCDPKDSTFHQGVGVALYQAKDYEGAARELGAWLKDAEDSWTIHCRLCLAISLAKTGHIDSAKRAFDLVDAVLKRNPTAKESVTDIYAEAARLLGRADGPPPSAVGQESAGGH